MLFEAEGVKTGGGENWIPLCLPGFNRNGYLYMYVSFMSPNEKNGKESNDKNESGKHEEVAVLLISANKESFYDLRTMRDAVVEVSLYLIYLHENGKIYLTNSPRNLKPTTAWPS